MTTPFGPQLIGETEKTLNALLRRFLRDSGLTEPEWVVLRISESPHRELGAAALVQAVADRAHFPDAADLVDELTGRGLLADGRPTDTGRAVLADVKASIATTTAPIWEGLPTQDVEAATRVLNEVVARARAVLA